MRGLDFEVERLVPQKYKQFFLDMNSSLVCSALVVVVVAAAAAAAAAAVPDGGLRVPTVGHSCAPAAAETTSPLSRVTLCAQQDYGGAAVSSSALIQRLDGAEMKN